MSTFEMTMNSAAVAKGRTHNEERTKELRDAFIAKAAIIHCGKYDYSSVSYVNSKTKVTIVCGVHGAFEQFPQQHTAQKQGCRECGKLEAAMKKSTNYTQTYQTGVRYSKQDLVEKANAIHGGLYDYTETEYLNMAGKVTITCARHGPFEQTMLAHIYKRRGCPFCGGTTKLTRELFISRAHAKHDGKYDYTDTLYNTVESMVSIRCPIHGVFEQKASKHLLGRGCFSCAKSLSSHKAEDWLAYMSFKTGNVIKRAWLGGEYVLRFDDGTTAKLDGFAADSNTAYEFHGTFYHGHPDFYPAEKAHPLYKRVNKTHGDVYNGTIAREKKIMHIGLHLVVMWEHDWDRIMRAIVLIQRTWKKVVTKRHDYRTQTPLAFVTPSPTTNPATSGKWMGAWMARKEMVSQAAKERYLKTRDKIKEKRASPEAREQRNKLNRERYLADPEFRRKLNERDAARYQINREEINRRAAERQRQQRIADPEKHRERRRRYHITYKEKLANKKLNDTS